MEYTRWHYVYFGYSRDQKLAHARVEFAGNRKEEAKFPNTF